MEASTTNVIFSNPERKPLEDVKLEVLEDGEKIKVPALHKRWVVRKFFCEYRPLIKSGGKVLINADLDEWLYEANWFLKDMNFLLQLRHFEFWSYLVYQKDVMHSLKTFLKNATPFYHDPPVLIPDQEILSLYNEILTSVTRVICRILTNKESDEEWISKDRLKDLIYSNFLISIPMLFDLIIALGECNSKMLCKIFKTVFLIEPKYKNDLTAALQHFGKTFDFLQHQAENDGSIEEGETRNEDLETPYDDLVLFTLDSAFTLSILLEVYPDARKICCDIKLAQKITNFYDNTIPYLYKNIYLINQNATSLKWLNEIRIQFLKAFRSIVYLHIEDVLMYPENSLMPCERFVSVMTECLSDRIFVIDYQRMYPIELDVDIMKQACKDLDEFKTDFVAKGYKDEAESESTNMIGIYANMDLNELEIKPSSSKPITSLPKRPEPEGAFLINYDSDKPSTSKASKKSLPATAKKSTNNKVSKTRDIDLEITTVLDVLPHLGDGFIRRVLSRYDSSEEAIAAILEENLPPDLIHANKSEVYIPPDPQDTLYQQTGIKRYNVFDGDKYDVMTQDNPDCIIKIDKGFPNAPQSLNEMLDDKKDLEAVRHRYQEYTLVDEYDDEYDDSYEALLETESRAVKSKQLNSRLADIDDVSEAESENESEEEDQNGGELSNINGKEKFDKRMNFCENPEDIRARYEAKRAAKYGNTNNAGRAPAPQPTRDVVGGPKGKGQAEEVVINRHKKDVHKSSRANHNRKAGAAFKRSKGMMS